MAQNHVQVGFAGEERPHVGVLMGLDYSMSHPTLTPLPYYEPYIMMNVKHEEAKMLAESNATKAEPPAPAAPPVAPPPAQPQKTPAPPEKGDGVYFCKLCNYKTNYKCHMKTHEAAKHSGVNYHCEHCNFQTSWKQGLKRHYNKKHKIATPPAAQENVSYGGPTMVKNNYNPPPFQSHFLEELDEEQLTKNEEGMYTCKECGYKTSYKCHLKTHVNAKHSRIVFYCQHCDFKTSWKKGLKRHYDKKHKNVYQSMRPAGGSRKRKNNNNHQIIVAPPAHHHNIEFMRHNKVFPINCNVEKLGDGYFHCPSCEYKTVHKHHLKTHQNAKHGNEMFFCHLCDFKTSWKKGLKRHFNLKHKPQIQQEAQIQPEDHQELQEQEEQDRLAQEQQERQQP